MSVLALRLSGPMQSWGLDSKSVIRKADHFPTRSALTGMICSAFGIPRNENHGHLDLESLSFAACEIKPGNVERDFQTMSGLYTVEGAPRDPDTLPSPRWYRSEADFLAFFEGETSVLEPIAEAMRKPVWPLFLGRKSFLPSRLISPPGNLFPGNLDDYLKQALDQTHSGKRLFRCLRETKDSKVEQNVEIRQYDRPGKVLDRQFSPNRYTIDYYELTGEPANLLKEPF